MSVKINTRKLLNANAYNWLIIREVDGNYFVKVNGEKLSDEYISISYKLSDILKKKDDSEKIIAIVESFLVHTKINSIEPLVLCSGYEGTFIKLDGSKKLYLQIKNPELLKTIIKMIKSKYDRDRYEYCNNVNYNNSYSIFLNRNVSSYDRRFVSCDDCSGCQVDKDCPKSIHFKLLYINGKIANFDKVFIERFIYDKLWEVGTEAIILEETKDIKLIDGITKVGKYVDSYSIICGDLTIKFSCTLFSRAYIFDFCNNIVNRYNRELSERDNSVKKRQLKMEEY